MMNWDGVDFGIFRLLFTLVFDGVLLLGLMVFTCDLIEHIARKRMQK